MENFANSTAPAKPLTGQIWYDTTNGEITVYSGSTFKRIGGATSQTTAPSGQVLGDLWYDTTNGQLKVYDGATFQLVGPSFTTGTGTSGAVVDTMIDTLAGTHTVVKMFVSDVIVAIISKDASFTPNPSLTGFATVEKGYNLNSSLTGALYVGGSSDASSLGGVAAADYLISNGSDSTSGVLSILNDTGLVVGADSDLTVGVATTSVVFNNTNALGDTLFNSNGTTVLTIDGGTNLPTVRADPGAALGIATKQYVDAISKDAIVSANTTHTFTLDNTANILPNVNNTFKLGSATFKFLEVFATTFTGVSTSAQYSDLAEKFTADAVYAPGTIVALGGPEEITKVNEDLSNEVFGVVSTDPGFMMNNALEGGTFVALSGRVPLHIVGTVSKGQRLVSAGDGKARGALSGEATLFNVIGRALEAGTDTIIEAFVTVS